MILSPSKKKSSCISISWILKSVISNFCFNLDYQFNGRVGRGGEGMILMLSQKIIKYIDFSGLQVADFKFLLQFGPSVHPKSLKGIIYKGRGDDIFTIIIIYINF